MTSDTATGHRGRLIEPLTEPPDIDLDLPGSKSLVNRALVAAALADGPSRLTRVLVADDTVAMMESLTRLGATIDVDAALGTATVDPLAADTPTDEVVLDTRQSGTTTRFLLPLAAARPSPTIVDGHPQVRARPQADLVGALRHLGARVDPLGDDAGQLPLRLQGPLDGTRVVLAGNVSSQFISGLLLIGPTLAQGLVVELSTEPVSWPYLTMTVGVMRHFGAVVSVQGRHRFVVEPSGYRASDYDIEPDASTASYFFATAAISGGRVRVQGLGSASLQGDVAFADVLGRMGAQVTITEATTQVEGTGVLRGVDADFVDISDTAPTMAAVAPFADTPTRVRGVGFIRAKESDRIAAVTTELRRCGIDASEEPDGFTIVPGDPAGAAIHTYQDHRIAMSFAVLGLRVPGIEILDPDCVSKTFPRFWETLDQIRGSGTPAPRVVALDGPAGSGKSTVAKRLAQRIGVEYLDTGAMYRAIAQAVLAAGLDPAGGEEVAAVARGAEIDIGERVIVNGNDVTEIIRGPEVTAAVSPVAANPGVRTVLRERQRQWARSRGGGVLEGRDIGTVVFPDAALKVFLTASPDERARRRAEQSGQDAGAVLEDIRRRDHLDSTRAESPMAEAPDAVVVDTTGLGIDEVVDHIVGLLP